MIIIPIGIDCAVADFLNKFKLRNNSYPFDWVVTYTGINDIIENSFFRLYS